MARNNTFDLALHLVSKLKVKKCDLKVFFPVLYRLRWLELLHGYMLLLYVLINFIARKIVNVLTDQRRVGSNRSNH